MKNPLKQLLPAKVRLYTYGVAFLGLAGWGVYEASEGDWRKAVPLGLTAVINLLAGSNVDTSTPADPAPDQD